MRACFWLIGWLLCWQPTLALAQQKVQPALRDELQIPQVAFEQLYKRFGEPQDLNHHAFRLQLVESIRLLEYAEQSLDKALWQQNRVGFSPDWHIQAMLHQILRQVAKHFQLESPRLPQVKLERDVLQRHLGAAGILGYQVSSAKLTELEQVVLARHLSKAANTEQELTLAQVYQQLSVQLRKRLHENDVALLQQLVTNWLVSMQQTNRLLFSGKLSEFQFASIAHAIRAYHHRPQILNALGVIKRHHGDNPGLKPFKSQVTLAEIAAYYQAHRQDFRYISSVNFSYQRFQQREQALTFKSTAKSSPQPWLQSQAKLPAQSWLFNLAAALEQSIVHGPIRSPKGDWVVVTVSEKRWATYPLDSETVRYQSINHLAQQKAKQAYSQLQQQLAQQHQVVLDVL